MIGITMDDLNIRTGPGVKYKIIDKLTKNSTVEIVGKDEKTGWYMIKYDKIYPYVSNRYVNINIETVETPPRYLNCIEEQGIIEGKYYVCKLKQCKITAYGGDDSSASKIPLNLGKTCGSFNLPYGTKIYIPSLDGFKFTDKKGKTVTCDGIFTVNDTGVGCTDFDIYMSTYSDNDAEKIFGGTKREDVYILSYGEGYGYSWSYTQSYEFAYKYNTLPLYKNAFKDYIKYGGTLINFTKFKNNDEDIRNSKYWNILNT